jgi:hypothetical protein
MSVELFRDDDRGYLAWLGANASGFVLNIQRIIRRVMKHGAGPAGTVGGAPEPPGREVA